MLFRSGLDGWYVGPSPKHYQCYDVWIWETRDVRTALTVSWFPSKIVMPCQRIGRTEGQMSLVTSDATLKAIVMTDQIWLITWTGFNIARTYVEPPPCKHTYVVDGRYGFSIPDGMRRQPCDPPTSRHKLGNTV